MNMDLDLNGNSLEGVSVNSPFFIQGWYEKAKDSHGIYLNPVNEFQIIPFDCVLNKIVYFGVVPVMNLKDPSQPHLCYCLQYRIWDRITRRTREKGQQ